MIYVPSDYSMIQAAINAASDGDDVVVANGTYTGDGNKNLDFLGKAITVRSESGPEHCIIDCENNGRGFYFHSEEDGNSVLQGFTIRNGKPPGDIAGSSGGGILLEYSSPTITDCTFTGNVATSWGGGIFISHSSPTIADCTFTGNVATSWGGGILCNHSSPTITDCTFIDNSSGYGAGGIGCYFSPATIMNCTLEDNSTKWGGGMCFHDAPPTIINCTFAGNVASMGGGGICCYSSSFPTIVNCTIVGNIAKNSGGICSAHSSGPMVVNTILWNIGDEVFLNDASITIRYSNVQGGYEGEGNIDAAPMLSNPRQSDFHLLPTSPCIGAGTNIGAPLFDKDGNPRPNPPNSSCDIGAYESSLGEPESVRLAPKIALEKKLASTWGQIKKKF